MDLTREEKCKLAISKGFIYDADSGKIYGVRGKEVKTIGSQGYINIILCYNKKRYDLRAHHFAYYWVYKEANSDVDHKNGIRHDNKISNLRKVTIQENAFNRTKAKGYYLNKYNKWVAQIKIDGKSKHIGTFLTEIEAREAYLKEKEKIHIFKSDGNNSNNSRREESCN